MGCNCGGSVRRPAERARDRQPGQPQRATHLAKPPTPVRAGGPGDPDGGYYARPRNPAAAAK